MTKGYKAIVGLQLEKGADVIAQEGNCGKLWEECSMLPQSFQV
jgi:hypothetical protein